ncbi:MAG TPA: cupredoxin domain-containing protein [Pseudolabrys sp.]|nr:cupredoxin domain-containing protein [Pseudolabrys sp.]
MRILSKVLVILLAAVFTPGSFSPLDLTAHAEPAALTIQISVKNHHFQPAEIHAPANTPIMLRVKNQDSTPMEFESVTLRVEKVVVGNGEGLMRIRPLAAGRYEFFDDFNPDTRGALVVQ